MFGLIFFSSFMGIFIGIGIVVSEKREMEKAHREYCMMYGIEE